MERAPRPTPKPAGDVPAAPRPVPGSAVWHEHLLPFATGSSWLVIGAVALVVARLEGLPPPEEAGRGSGAAWLVGLALIVTGAALLSWALLRSGWWAHLQRHGRATDARVERIDPVGWISISGRHPLRLHLRYRDQAGGERQCRVWLRLDSYADRVTHGDSVVIVHSRTRPDVAALYWDR